MADRGDWHSIGAEQALEALKGAREGLTAEEAEARLAAYGPNALPQSRPRHSVLRFLSQFNGEPSALRPWPV